MNIVITILLVAAGIIALVLFIALFMKKEVMPNVKLSSMRRGKKYLTM